MSTIMPVMPSAIEEGILQHLQRRGFTDGNGRPIAQFDVRKGVDGFAAVNSDTAIGVVIVPFEFEPLSNDGDVKVKFTVQIMVGVKNLREESARRKAIYPLVMGIVQTLMGEDLDLGIDPLQPKTAEELSSEELTSRGLIVYAITFSSSFDMDPEEDSEEKNPWIMSAVAYFNTITDNGAADRTDLIQGV